MRRNKDRKISFNKLRFLLAVFFILDRLILVENDRIFGSGSIVRMRRNKDGKICSFKLRFMDAVFDSGSINTSWKWPIFGSGSIVRMCRNKNGKICSFKLRLMDAVFDSVSIGAGWKWTIFRSGCIVRMQMWSWVHKICSNKSRFLNAVYDSGSIDTNEKNHLFLAPDALVRMHRCRNWNPPFWAKLDISIPLKWTRLENGIVKGLSDSTIPDFHVNYPR